MTEQPRDTARDEDVEGHRPAPRHADAEQAEGDDNVEGHRRFPGNQADAEQAEGDDDVEGHLKRGSF